MVIEIDDASQIGDTNVLYLNMDKLISLFFNVIKMYPGACEIFS